MSPVHICCAVSTCKNCKRAGDHTSKKFYKFPNDIEQRNEWLLLCGGGVKQVTRSKNPRICSDHFESDLLHSLKCRLLGTANSGKLCHCTIPENEIPTLNLPNTKRTLTILNKHAKIKSHLEKLSERKQIINELLLKSKLEELGEIGSKTNFNGRGLQNGNNCPPSKQEFVENVIIDVPNSPEENLFILSNDMETNEGESELYELSDAESFIQDLCRLCSLNKDNLIAVFGAEGIKLELQKKINMCLPIKIEETDLLPQVVCKKCVSEVERFYSFIMSCQDADQFLQNKYKSMHPGYDPLEPIDESYCMMEDLSTEFPVDIINEPKSNKINLRIQDKSTQPQKLNFFFVERVPSLEENAHSQKFPERCQLCQLLLCSTTDAKQHYMHEHNKFICNHCSEYFNTRTEFSDHTNKLHAVKNAQTNFTVKSSEEHIFELNDNKMNVVSTDLDQCNQKVKKRISKQRKLLLCKYCPKHFINRTCYKEHFLTSHNKHICMYCWEDFDTECELQSHIKAMSHSVVCNLCKTWFTSPRGLEMHITKSHFGKEHQIEYECRVCCSIYSTKKYIKKHYFKCHSLYFCIVCEANFNTAVELDDHMKEQIHMECDRCEHIGFSKWEEYIEHITSHNSLLCIKCNKNFATEKIFKKHVLNEHSSFKYLCTQCNKKFKLSIYLKRHMKSHNEKTVTCILCDKRFADKVALKLHMVCHSEERNFICDQCGVQFKHKRNLQSHLKAVHLQWEYMCALCNESCSSEVDVVKHFNNHTDEEKVDFAGNPFLKISPYHCEICDKYFGSKLYISAHMKQKHQGENGSQSERIQCDECKKIFSSKQYMLSHYRQKHITIENKFFCEICKMGYISRFRFQLHMKQHEQTREKVHNCPHCDRVFPKYQNLRKHITIVHYKVKKYKCNICNKCFTRNCHLKQHSVVHTGVKAFKCEICLKQYSQMGDMRRHRNKHFETAAVAKEFIEIEEPSPGVIIVPEATSFDIVVLDERLL